MADGYKITGQNQRRTLNGAGGFVDQVEVHFSTDNGATASVLVPVAQYNAAEVKRRIDAYAAELNAVHNL